MRLIACVSFLFVVLAGARPDNYGGPFILAPPSVEAGTSFEARVVNMEISGGNTTYCHAFRIYLASTPLETDYYRSYIKDCYLLREQTLCNPKITKGEDYIAFGYPNTPFNVTIPQDVGPSGPHYMLKLAILQTDGSVWGALLESNVIDLVGGTGEWASYKLENANSPLLNAAPGIPCEHYSCGRRCLDKFIYNASAYEQSNPLNCGDGCPITLENWMIYPGRPPNASLTLPPACQASYPTHPTDETRPIDVAPSNDASLASILRSWTLLVTLAAFALARSL